MTRYRRIDGVSERQVDDDLFIVVPATEAVFHLNPVGTALWRMLAEPHDLDEIVGELAEIFDEAEVSQLRNDAETFLQQLAEHNLLDEQTNG